jgi:hypothetical protein
MSVKNDKKKPATKWCGLFLKVHLRTDQLTPPLKGIITTRMRTIDAKLPNISNYTKVSNELSQGENIGS